MDLTIDLDNDKQITIRSCLYIEYNNKVLVEMYKDNYGCLPGGRLKFAESSNETLIREIKEELGLDLTKYNYTFGSIVESLIEDKFYIISYVYKLELNDIELYNKFNNMHNLDTDDGIYVWINKDELYNNLIFCKNVNNSFKDKILFENIKR